MWMMGCSDGGGYNMSDTFNPPRKIRPIIPKPCSSTYGNGNIGNGLATCTTTSHPCFNRIHGTDLFLLNHHLATEQSRKEVNAPTLASSRWNPTPEQLHTLEELYRCGTRTPSADQIQQITAQLRRYGKIEGKNVFYWFQNHKARERQKRRRQTEKPLQHKEIDNQVEEEEEEAKNWGLSTNLTTTLTQQQGRTARTEEESRTTGEREFQQRRRSLENHATWQKMHLTTYSPSITLTPSTTPTTTSTTTSTTSTSTNTTTIYQMRTDNPNLTKAGAHFLRSNQEEAQDSHTLELFPLRNNENGGGKETQGVSTSATEDTITNCSGYQFIEFL